MEGLRGAENVEVKKRVQKKCKHYSIYETSDLCPLLDNQRYLKAHNQTNKSDHILCFVDSRTKCNREEERGEKFERGDVVMFLPGSVVE